MSKPSQSPTTNRSTTKSNSPRKRTIRRHQLVGDLYRPICKILILIGIATLLLAAVTIWQYRFATKRIYTTEATVTSISKVNGVGVDEHGIDSQKCHLHYKFTINSIEYTDSLGYRGDPTTDKCQLATGRLVEVNYDAKHPSNNAYSVDDHRSSHKTFASTISSAVGIATIGLIPLALGVLGLQLATDRKYKLQSIKSKITDKKHR